MTRTHHLDTTKAISIYSTKCGHCQKATIHELRMCGLARICSVCTECEWHKRIGTWVDTMPKEEHTNQEKLFPPGRLV